MKIPPFIFIILFILSCGKEQKGKAPIEIPEFENLAIDVAPDQSRPFVFTDKGSAFFYGETGTRDQDGHQGFYAMAQRYLEDYLLAIDGHQIDRKDADTVKVYPDRLCRIYQKNVIESVYLLDNLNCLVIELNSPDLHSFDFTPLLPTTYDLENMRNKWIRNQDLFILGQKNSEKRSATDSHLQFLGIRFDWSTQFKSENKTLVVNSRPVQQIGRFRTAKDFYRIYILVAENEAEIKRVSDDVLKNIDQLIDAKKQRLIKMLGDNHFETNLPDLNKAFRWAVISMDQLIMKQPAARKEMIGIFAGLPWFNNYWGRDTFISLPGATLVTGKFQDARDILLSFAKFQATNPDDPNYGRIPNQITSDQIIYNTADGTPWFVRELWEYYLYTGDLDLLKALYAVVKRANEGTLKYHVDKNYFLTHGDAETWMDAQGAEGPWSPRGNRAVEIQVLWYEQLLASSKIADLMGDRSLADSWLQIAMELRQAFQRMFWNDKGVALFDHLNSDDSPDQKSRPNQIFAVTVPDQPIQTAEREFMIVREVTTRLTYPYGVASLWQHDPDFHPYHVYPKYYPKDAAYHNGTVWGWLSGPLITSLMKFGYSNLAFELLSSETNQILRWGAVGTLSELLNAIPAPGNALPEPSGTVTQAWSLAEYLRNIYQDLIGINPLVPEKKIVIAPHLPDEISSLTCRVPIANSNIHLSIQQGLRNVDLELDYVEGNQNWEIEINFQLSPIEKILFNFPLRLSETKKVQILTAPMTTVSIDGKEIGYRLEKMPVREEIFNYFSFAVPQLEKNLNYLKPPPYPLWTGAQIKSWNKKAITLIDVDAPKSDDTGPNKKYVYPTNPYFAEGILDLTKFQLFEDKDNYYFRLYFRNLIQPGWHPEYGFQLTFVAIAIDQQAGESGAKFISRNANLRLPNDIAYHRIIFIGGGLQLEDAQGNILAAFRPEEASYPLGDVQKKEISFAIPKTFLGNYEKNWRFAIAVGAQDDHGGGGIGEFRTVGIAASEWQGGGADQATGNCNVYDFFIVR